jgi:hypothetical protein
MRYRHCKIWQNDFGKYEWQHPNRVDYDPEIGSIWSGWGYTVEECIEQIDEWYERTKGE